VRLYRHKDGTLIMLADYLHRCYICGHIVLAPRRTHVGTRRARAHVAVRRLLRMLTAE
jgi:hypothetical protein